MDPFGTHWGSLWPPWGRLRPRWGLVGAHLGSVRVRAYLGPGLGSACRWAPPVGPSSIALRDCARSAAATLAAAPRLHRSCDAVLSRRGPPGAPGCTSGNTRNDFERGLHVVFLCTRAAARRRPHATGRAPRGPPLPAGPREPGPTRDQISGLANLFQGVTQYRHRHKEDSFSSGALFCTQNEQ